MIRNATPSDASSILRLLKSQDLVTADLDSTNWAHFFIFTRNGDIQGVVGLEVFGSTGLLRSLAVASDHQSHQIGTKLIRTLIDYAHDQNLETLYLLTTTARPFFERFGFVAISRESAPPIIKATAEFSQLCPAEAVVMRHQV